MCWYLFCIELTPLQFDVTHWWNQYLQPQSQRHQRTLASPLHVGQMLNVERGMVQVLAPACLAMKVTHTIREVVGANVNSTQTALKCWRASHSSAWIHVQEHVVLELSAACWITFQRARVHHNLPGTPSSNVEHYRQHVSYFAFFFICSWKIINKLRFVIPLFSLVFWSRLFYLHPVCLCLILLK
jgi:hypothetical protein